MAEKQPVRVTIFKQPYTLLAHGDPRELTDAAQTVDELMHAIAAKAPTADATRIAVLACVHLADKLRMAEHELALFRDRTEEIGELLDQAIKTGT